MKLLALDTSNQAMSVAVMDDAQVLGETTINHKKTHSEELMPVMRALLTSSNLQPDELDRVVVADGPGSYTGVRIAVTTGKTLAYTLGIDLVGISSLAVLAANVTRTKNMIIPLMDARRHNVFAGGYQWLHGQLINVIADRHIALQQLLAEVAILAQPVTFVGVDVPKFTGDIEGALGASAHFVDAVSALPRASRLGALGRFAPTTNVFTFVPRYLRLTEAEVNWLKTHDDKGHEPYVEKV